MGLLAVVGGLVLIGAIGMAYPFSKPYQMWISYASGKYKRRINPKKDFTDNHIV